MTPQPHEAWPVWKLALLSYPMASGTVWINLFMVPLMGNAIRIGSLRPMQAVVFAIILGVSAAWATGRWLRRLMDEAND